ncbi:MAG: hypothetical protein JO112_16810, partial [Planctomycetes bacterium]|nr:hypothetical protein [Planctomycetota bacterium]
MPATGWKQLQAGWPWFQGPGRFPIAAYSEFLPPPWLGCKPYGETDDTFAADDPWGWRVTEYEEALQLRPGLNHLAQHLLNALVHLGQGRATHGISRHKLVDNPYWPPRLAHRAGSLAHERYLLLLPLALARTQDDKGRVRWTLFGASEQGPAQAFWKSFYTAPGKEVPAEQALSFLRRLLRLVYHEPEDHLHDLHKAGFRILPQQEPPLFPWWREDLPAWTAPWIWTEKQPFRGIRYLLTFRPFAQLPGEVQQAYLDGQLHLLPFPGSLLFWGARHLPQLQKGGPLSVQMPLLPLLARHEDPFSIRVPQSGWMHEPRPGQSTPEEPHGPIRNTYLRTHRWTPLHRYEDELAVLKGEDKLAHVLFSTAPEDMGLYDKPMARNVQLWTHDFQQLLNGPRASWPEIHQAMTTVCGGGLFTYRFQFPAMRVGPYEVYWHRPLAAYLSAQTGQPALLPAAPL